MGWCLYTILLFSSYSCPENLVAKTGHFYFWFRRGCGLWLRRRKGYPVEIFRIFTIFTIITLFYTEGDLSVAVLWLFLLLFFFFLLWFRYPAIFFYVFSVIVFCVILGEGRVVSPPNVYSLSI